MATGLSREASKAETRSALLRTAARMFALQGIDATSLDRIAGELGLTKGAVYAHFSNKHDLVFAVADAFETEPRQVRLRALLFDETRSLADRMRRIARAGTALLDEGIIGLSALETMLLDLEYFMYGLRDRDPEVLEATRRSYLQFGKDLDEIQERRGEPLALAGETVLPVFINVYRGLALAYVQAPDLVPASVLEDALGALGTFWMTPRGKPKKRR